MSRYDDDNVIRDTNINDVFLAVVKGMDGILFGVGITAFAFVFMMFLAIPQIMNNDGNCTADGYLRAAVKINHKVVIVRSEDPVASCPGRDVKQP